MIEKWISEGLAFFAMRLGRWLGHKFYNLDTFYPNDDSIESNSGNHWPCSFKKNVKLLTDEERRRRTTMYEN